MLFIEISFWILIAGVFYTYVGYGLIAWLWIRLRGPRPQRFSDYLPDVALIVAAYNEENVLDQKLKNTFALNYPKEKISFFFVTDGSTDRSVEYLKNQPGIRHLHKPERKGKNAAINHAVGKVRRADLLVFSDANTMLNPDAILLLVRHFGDDRVGGVSGEKRVLDARGSGEEGFYWRYESTLKRLDAQLNTLVGAAGELFSMRFNLFEQIPENIILDDFYLSMRICARGFRVGYEPNAVASEYPSVSLDEEAERKVRISAGAFQALEKLGYLANPLKYGVTGLQFLSRRVMRWVFCPVALPLILFLNILLVADAIEPRALYQGLLVSEFFFYGLAVIGWVWHTVGQSPPRWISLPHYFVFMNFSVWLGFVRYITGKQSILWEKASRASSAS